MLTKYALVAIVVQSPLIEGGWPFFESSKSEHQAFSLQPVLTRTARNNRSVHEVREDCEHCPGQKWQRR